MDEIVNLLERNQCTLDESIALFEEGLKLSQELSVQLKSYEDKVKAYIEEQKRKERIDFVKLEHEKFKKKSDFVNTFNDFFYRFIQ